MIIRLFQVRKAAKQTLLGVHAGAVWSWIKKSSAFVAKKSCFCQGYWKVSLYLLLGFS